MKQGEVMGTEKQKIIFKPEKKIHRGGVMTKKFDLERALKGEPVGQSLIERPEK